MTSVAMAVSAAGLVALASMPGSAVAAPASSGLAFSKPATLGPGSFNANGGEPSLGSDGEGDVYVSAPQGLGAVNQYGVAFWTSRDHGRTWNQPDNIGSGQGGGDSDLAVAPDDPSTVYIADLNGTSSTICVSHDKGVTFKNANVQNVNDPNNCKFAAATSQYGYSSDRQWLTTDDNGRIYLSYHELASEEPLIWRDDKGGADGFTDGPCGRIVTDPQLQADVLVNTIDAKPVIDDAGNLYILTVTATQQEQADAVQNGRAGSNASIAFVAVSTDHCQSFTDHVLFDGSKLGSNVVQFGDIFNVIGMDAAGNLYAAAAGYVGTTKFDKVARMYFFRSLDHGATWDPPQEIDSDTSAHMLPAIVGGAHPGEVAIGYFRTVNGITDPNDVRGRWTYTVAESTDAAGPHPHFTYADVDPGVVYHSGDICNSGALCGTYVPGTGFDRSLLDFTSATLDNADCPLFNFAGNPSFNPPAKSPTIVLPLPAIPVLPPAPPPQPTVTLPFVTRQQEPCFRLGAAQAAVAPSPHQAAISPSPVAVASPSPSPVALAPLPNTAPASTRTLAMLAFAALFLLALIGRSLSGRRLR